MLYEANVFLDAGAGTAATHVFSANGCYDPDITGIGHQPRGFDELMNLYDHYVVTGAKMSVTFQNADPGVAAICGIKINDAATTLTTANDYIETGNCNFKHASISGSGGLCTVTKALNIGHFLGDRDVLTDSQCKGSPAMNPVEQCYFHVWCASIDGASDLAQVKAHVSIEYACTLNEPTKTAQS